MKPAAVSGDGKRMPAQESRGKHTQTRLEKGMRISIYTPRVSEISEETKRCFVAFRVTKEDFKLYVADSGRGINVALSSLTTRQLPWADLVLNSLEFCATEQKAKKLLMAQEFFDQFKNKIPVILVIEGYSDKAFVDLFTGVGVTGTNFTKNSSHKFMSCGLLDFLQQKKRESIRQDVLVGEYYGNNEQEMHDIQARLRDKEIVSEGTASEIEKKLQKLDASVLGKAEAESRECRQAAAP